MKRSRRAQGIVGMIGLTILAIGILLVVVEVGHMMTFAARIADIADAAARAAAQEVIQRHKEDTGEWYLVKAPYRSTYREAAEETAVAAARENGVAELIGQDLVPGDHIQVSVGSVDSSRHCLSSLSGSSHFTIGDQKIYQCARVTLSVPYRFLVMQSLFDVGVSPGRFETTATAIPVVARTR